MSFNYLIILTKVITYDKIIKDRSDHMSKNKNYMAPEYEGITAFQKGKASKLFKKVVDEDQILIVSKQNKPQNVIISYDRYLRLKKQGIEI